MKEIRTIIGCYDAWKQEEVALALATVVNTEASSYRRIGARMLVASDGRWTGGISGGCLEGDALRRTRMVMQHQRPMISVYDTRDGDDAVIGIGLGCEGRIEVLFEPIDVDKNDNAIEQLKAIVNTRSTLELYKVINNKDAVVDSRTFQEVRVLAKELGLDADAISQLRSVSENHAKKSRMLSVAGYRILIEKILPEIRIVALGDNYDVTALARQCEVLGWPLSLVGTQRKFTVDQFRLARKLTDFKKLESVTIDNFTAVVLMSHDYPKDLAGLKHFLPQSPFYLGLLGPVKRRDKLLAELEVKEVPACLYGPVGLNIGAQTPEEIALSITADILKVLRQRPGGSLKTIRGSIYNN